MSELLTTVRNLGTHAEAAQLLLEELHKWREQIPRFAIPETSDAAQRLSPAAAVPTVFIELTNVAVANQTPLVRADGTRCGRALLTAT